MQPSFTKLWLKGCCITPTDAFLGRKHAARACFCGKIPNFVPNFGNRALPMSGHANGVAVFASVRGSIAASSTGMMNLFSRPF